MLRTNSAQPMIEVENSQLLASQQPLEQLAQKPLSGVHALKLSEILSAASEHLERLGEVQQDLMSREDLSEQEADEEWQQVMQETTEIAHDPLPEEAVEGIEVSASTLMALDWLIRDEEEEQ